MDNDSSESQVPEKSLQPGNIARRRLLRGGLAAAPVVLAVSGRSAMAGTSCTGLSPIAWASVAPTNTCNAAISHTVESRVLGQPQSYWADPNVNQCRNWPSSVPKNTKFSDKFPPSTLATTFGALITANADDVTTKLVIAYLNAMKFPDTYALQPSEVVYAAANRKLLGTNVNLVIDGDFKRFLNQTWGVVS